MWISFTCHIRLPGFWTPCFALHLSLLLTNHLLLSDLRLHFDYKNASFLLALMNWWSRDSRYTAQWFSTLSEVFCFLQYRQVLGLNDVKGTTNGTYIDSLCYNISFRFYSAWSQIMPCMYWCSASLSLHSCYADATLHSIQYYSEHLTGCQKS